MIRFRKSVGFELSRYILVTMILFLAAILIFSIKYISIFFIRVAEEQAMTVLYETDYKINSFLKDIENLSESLVNYSAVYEARTEEMRELFIANVLARKKHVRAIYLGTASGQMYEWGHGEGFVNNTPTFPEGYNPVLRPWYQTAIAKKAHAITSPYVYASIDKTGITSVNPVYNKKTGAFTGVLGIDVMLETMNEFLMEINITDSGSSVLMTDDGYIIASQFERESGSGPVNLHDVLNDKIKKMAPEKTGRFQTRYREEDYFFVFSRNSVTGWILAIGYPYSAITSGLNRALAVISVVYLFMTLMLTFTLAAISRVIIVKPLEDLFSVMKMIEGGDHGARVDIISDNEFAILGRQFNSLFTLVQEYSQCLERKVEERTREVINLQHENTRLRIIEEKERISGELHDSIGARLTNISICNNVAISLAGEGNPELGKMLKSTDENCSVAIQELRDIVNGISRQTVFEKFACFMDEDIPERLGLKNIKATVRWKEGKKKISVFVNEKTAGDAVKILEELVSNILKHSMADSVRIEIFTRRKAIAIRVTDNGKGFDMAASGRQDGYGLRNIRQRLEKGGGHLEIKTSPGAGTSVVLFFPPEEAGEYEQD